MAVPALAEPGELPSEPILRINAPGHIGLIRGIATDAKEQFAVTASDDKTVRVWSLPDGKLQRTIWLPSGTGPLGRAYAVASVADGRTIAVGGWTGPIGDFNIYLLDRASGTLTQRLPGLPNLVDHLAFSPDGRRLAAALFGAMGFASSTLATDIDLFRATATTATLATPSISTPTAAWFPRATTGLCGSTRRTIMTSQPCQKPGSKASAGLTPSRSRRMDDMLP